MNVLNSIKDIREAFNAGAITARQAADLLGNSKIKKPWHTKEWREQRGKLLGDACTQCGSKESPFVLQHLWQPQKLSEIAKEVRYKIRPVYQAEHPIPQVPIPEPDTKSEACPRCHRLSLYWRKTTEDWRCGNSKCKKIFEKPVVIPVHSAEQVAIWRTRQRAAKEEWYEIFREATDEIVLAEALPIAFEEHDRYLTLKDTTTFCVKCAFMWDKRGKKICKGCNGFIPIYLSESDCFTCLEKEFGFMSRDAVYEMHSN